MGRARDHAFFLRAARRLLLRLAPIALFGALAVACEATGDLGSLGSGKCPAGEKGCFLDGKEQCVGMSDPKTGCNAPNCLSCDAKVANAVSTCSATDTCTIAACDPGYLDCNQVDSDGCEVDSRLDVANCGLCGTVCAPEAHGEPLCLRGVCALRCAASYGDCDLKYSNGCEAQLLSDPAHCGACEIACPTGQTCMAGMCG